MKCEKIDNDVRAGFGCCAVRRLLPCFLIRRMPSVSATAMTGVVRGQATAGIIIAPRGSDSGFGMGNQRLSRRGGYGPGRSAGSGPDYDEPRSGSSGFGMGNEKGLSARGGYGPGRILAAARNMMIRAVARAAGMGNQRGYPPRGGYGQGRITDLAAMMRAPAYGPGLRSSQEAYPGMRSQCHKGNGYGTGTGAPGYSQPPAGYGLS